MCAFCYLSGKLDRGAVLKAICAGFQETTEPAICLTDGPHLAFSFFFLYIHVCVLYIFPVTAWPSFLFTILGCMFHLYNLIQ